MPKIPKEYLMFDPLRIYNPTNDTIGGEPIDSKLLNSLTEEAKYLVETHIWGVFQNVMKKDAIETMVNHSKTFEDMKTGKAMLNALHQLNLLIASFKNRK
jgi:hypothetical protein